MRDEWRDAILNGLSAEDATQRLLESFEEQMFGPCFILLRRTAPSAGDIAEQGCCDADPRIDGSRVDLKRALEIPPGLL